jgi:hypothetical protein
MLKTIYRYSFLGIIMIFFTISGCKQSENDFTHSTAPQVVDNVTEPSDMVQGPFIKQFCPQTEDLIKQETFWITKDQRNRWKSYTPSTASKVQGFLGAQWAGIKIGKIICLYQTNEAVTFPLAVEQVSSQSMLEPSGGGWSALTKNHRFCKSTSVVDCSFSPEPQRDNSNIYKDIGYNPKSAE